MADVTKRLRYFDGQVLGAQDFTDEQHYVLDRQRRYSRFLNVAGIVDGLEVRTAVAPGQVEVDPGTALDALGRQVVLSDARTISLANRQGQTVELVIAYSQEEADPQPIAGEPVGHTRLHEEPYVGPNIALPPECTAPLTLARVTLDANGAVTQVDETPRVYAGIRLPDGKGTTGGVILRAHTRPRPDNLDQPGWHDVPYLNNWQRFDAIYNPAQYWKDSRGIVYLRGLIKGGTNIGADGFPAFTLPDGYRPAYRQLHVGCTHDNALGRVDVLTNGNVVVVKGDNRYVSLDSIAFRAAESPPPPGWHDVPYVNNWVRYDAIYNPAQYWKDGQGIVHLRGLIKGGTNIGADGFPAFTLPDGYRPAYRQLHVGCTHDNALGRVDVLTNGNVVVVKGDNRYVSLDSIAFGLLRAPPPGWHDVPYVNNWVRYDAIYNPAQYWKDSQGIVHLRGLIKGGTTGATNDAGLAFTLPDGYRPAYRQLHVVCAHDNALGRVDVQTNGNVVVVSGSNVWVSLDSITFRAADSLASKGLTEEVLPRIVSGVVDANGASLAAVGFTVTRVADGLYDIMFAPPFAAIPAASVILISPGAGSQGGDTRDNAILVSLEQAKMRVKIGDNAGKPTDRSFSFIAIGPR